MPYILKQLAEKSHYDYVHLEGDDMILSVPVVGGGEVSSDNTCQASTAQKGFFFGTNNPITSNALSVLITMQQDIEFDLKILRTHALANQAAIQNKQNRLGQVQEYIKTLRVVAEDSSIRKALDQSFGYLVKGAEKLLENKTNALAMLLSPESKDSYTRFNTYQVNFSRSDSSSNFDGTLRSTFSKELQAYTVKPRVANYKQLLIDNIHDALPKDFRIKDDKDIETIKAIALQKFKDIIPNLPNGFSLDKSNIGNRDINLQYILTIMGYTDSSELDECIQDNKSNLDPYAYKAFIQSIIDSALASEFWTMVQPIDMFYKTYVYTKPKMLSIAAQFFIATAGIYANSANISKSDFGSIAEGSISSIFSASSVKNDIANIIVTALQHGQDVGQSILDYMNRNKYTFGLSRAFSPQECSAIINSFNNNFNAIFDSPHFDEFLLLLPHVKGDFFCQNGKISFPFSKFVEKHMSRSEYTQFYMNKNRLFDSYNFAEKYQNFLPSQSDLAPLNVSLTDSEILDIANRESPNYVAILLFNETEDGTLLFEKLADETILSIMACNNWQNIKSQAMILKGIKPKAIQDSFDRTFDQDNREVNVTLSIESAAFLQREALNKYRIREELFSPTDDKNHSSEKLKAILDALKIKYKSVSYANGAYKINLTNANFKSIQTIEAKYIESITLTEHMMICIIHAVREKFGTESEQAQALDAISDSNIVSKTITALAMLGLGAFHVSSSPAANTIDTRNGVHRISAASEKIAQISSVTSQFTHLVTSELQNRILETFKSAFGEHSPFYLQMNEMGPAQRISYALDNLGIGYLHLDQEGNATNANVHIIATQEQWGHIQKIQPLNAGLKYNYRISMQRAKAICNHVATNLTLPDSDEYVSIVHEENLAFALTRALNLIGVYEFTAIDLDIDQNQILIACEDSAKNIIQEMQVDNTELSDSSEIAFDPYLEEPIWQAESLFEEDAPANEETEYDTSKIPTFKDNDFDYVAENTYYFFYETFKSCKLLNMNQIRQNVDQQGDTLSDKIAKRIGCLFKADFRPQQDRPLCPIVTQGNYGLIQIEFTQRSGGKQAAKDFAYTLKRKAHVECETIYTSNHSCTIQINDNHEFLKQLFKCSEQNAMSLQQELSQMSLSQH